MNKQDTLLLEQSYDNVYNRHDQNTEKNISELIRFIRNKSDSLDRIYEAYDEMHSKIEAAMLPSYKSGGSPFDEEEMDEDYNTSEKIVGDLLDFKDKVKSILESLVQDFEEFENELTYEKNDDIMEELLKKYTGK